MLTMRARCVIVCYPASGDPAGACALPAATLRSASQRSQHEEVKVKGSWLNRSRFIVGLILVIGAALLFLFARGSYAVAGAAAIAVLGLASIATSRRK